MPKIKRSRLLLGVGAALVVPGMAWVVVAAAGQAAAAQGRPGLYTVAQADRGPVLTVQPTSVALGAMERTSVLLTLSAPASATLHRISLRLYHNGSMAAAVVRPFPKKLAAGADSFAIVDLRGGEQGMISGSLTAQVTACTGASPRSQAAVAVAVPVTERPTALPPLGLLTIPAAPTSIDDQHSGVVVARIADTTTVPIMVEALRPIAADSAGSVDIMPSRPFRPFTIRPGESRDVAFTAQTAPGFRPGSHVISIQASVSPVGGRRHQVLIADHAITVSVFGEEQITSAVGAVSFLLVPGLLVLVVVKLLWEQARPRRPLPWLDAKQGEFWAAAVTLSLAAIPVYFGITALFGPGRNLITAFDSVDILRLWVGSLIAGLLGWYVCLCAWTWQRIRPQNDATTVLKRLCRHGSLQMELATLQGQQGTFGLGDRLGGEVVLVPRIVYHSDQTQVRATLDNAVNTDNAKDFWARARDGRRNGTVTLRFEQNRAVAQVPEARVTDQNQQGRMVVSQ